MVLYSSVHFIIRLMQGFPVITIASAGCCLLSCGCVSGQSSKLQMAMAVYPFQGRARQIDDGNSADRRRIFIHVAVLDQRSSQYSGNTERPHFPDHTVMTSCHLPCGALIFALACFCFLAKRVEMFCISSTRSEDTGIYFAAERFRFTFL